MLSPYEMALTGDSDQLWDFVKKRVDTGTPVMSEHMDGGLIPAYRTKAGHRQLFFDGTVVPGWIDVDAFGPYAVYSFFREREQRALAKGRAHEWHGVPQGLAALHKYLGDVRDPTEDFEKTQEWFCWAAFERLMARRCSEVWLRSVAGGHFGRVATSLLAAAHHYGEAFRHYDLYLRETQRRDLPRQTLEQRARFPERIDACAPLLERGIKEEMLGLEALEEAVGLIQ